MRRRGRTGGKAEKKQRSKTLKRQNAPKIASNRISATASRQKNVVRLARERDEALEQLAATSEVLQVISRSAFDLKSVLQALVGSAARLCRADKGAIFVNDGDVYRLAAHSGLSSEEETQAKQYARERPLGPNRGSLVGRVAMDGRVVHIKDVLADADYLASAYQKAFSFRTDLGVPLLREGAVIGVFALMRTEVNPFTEAEIELVSTFASQAVIAIENTRLLNELRESLERQTATSEVLSIISSSAGGLQPVFETMLAKATALCEASYGTMWLREGDAFRAAAIYGALPEAFLELHQTGNLYRAGPGAPAYEAIINRQTCAVADLRETQGYREGSELPVAAADIGGVRTMVAVPMFGEDEPIGVISIYRREVRLGGRTRKCNSQNLLALPSSQCSGLALLVRLSNPPLQKSLTRLRSMPCAKQWRNTKTTRSRCATSTCRPSAASITPARKWPVTCTTPRAPWACTSSI